jgi:NAD(P)-dependent dehydrogenase (short-subunit alcohol dehydrogenase family)
MKRLEGKSALVTGGGRGIGRAIALAFADAGCTVAVSSRTLAELDAVVREIEARGARGLAVVADAMSYESIRDAVAQVVAAFGRIDILVNNAGGVLPGKTPLGLLSATHEDQAFIDNLTLNLVSAQRATREALPHMLRHGYGRIINIGSGYAKRSGGLPAYTAAKHGLIGLTRATAAEVAQRGVTVNCLCPGWTNTKLVDWNALGRSWGTDAEGARRKASAETLQNRVLEPEELGPMAALLASPDAAGITGQVISVDGGYGV